MLNPTVFNTSEICFQLGVKYAVISPGSRNAPLTISFARNSKIIKKVVPDERTAGFIALGIAQHTKQPVVLCCTSGTSLLNYAPAVTEAYYRQIPLIIFSADRPPELIDQRDGQTIRQFGALKNHVKRSIQLPVIESSKDEEEFQELIVDAIEESLALPMGPVHINVPFREPFYPELTQELNFNKLDLSSTRSIQKNKTSFSFPAGKKILVLIGQQEPDKDLSELTNKLRAKIPILRFPLNNLSSGIQHVDGFINDQKELIPDILITSGLSVLSKKLKTFLRKNKPDCHLHFDEGMVPVDTFQTKPELINQPIESVLEDLLETEVDEEYINKWISSELITKTTITNEMELLSFSETTATHAVINSLPIHSILHLSNSMPVRYADLFGVKESIKSYSNRGTSGIDGCTSTALGTAMVSDRTNILLTGELAFFYDRNAFFHNYMIPNLKIIIMNNQGGGIFRLIEGPSSLPELEEYFETRHSFTAQYICEENKFDYYPIHSESELNTHLNKFFSVSEKTAVMEIFTDPEENQKAYKKLRRSINEQVNKLEQGL